jgi:hypothetical protein
LCNCIEIVNDKLKERNTRLTIPMIFSAEYDPPRPPSLLIQTEQIETGRGKPKAVGMFASHCPFCGKKFVAEKVKAEAPLTTN